MRARVCVCVCVCVCTACLCRRERGEGCIAVPFREQFTTFCKSTPTFMQYAACSSSKRVHVLTDIFVIPRWWVHYSVQSEAVRCVWSGTRLHGLPVCQVELSACLSAKQINMAIVFETTLLQDRVIPDIIYYSLSRSRWTIYSQIHTKRGCCFFVIVSFCR